MEIQVSKSERKGKSDREGWYAMQGNILAVTSEEAERDKRSLSRSTQLARLLGIIMIQNFPLE